MINTQLADNELPKLLSEVIKTVLRARRVAFMAETNNWHYGKPFSISSMNSGRNIFACHDRLSTLSWI